MKRFESLARFTFRSNWRYVKPEFFQNSGRGKPAGGLRAAFFLVLGCARGATELEFRPLRRATKGSAFGNRDFLKKIE